MLLFRPPRGGVVPRKKLESEPGCFRKVSSHSFETALPAARWHIRSETLPPRSSRGRCESGTRFVSRADGRGLFCQTSPGRGTPGARESGHLGDSHRPIEETTNPKEGIEKRSVLLDSMEFFFCFRKGRRGAAAGPSGMTSDHLFPVLESEGDSESFVKVASMLAVGNVPDEIIEATRLGDCEES